MARKFEKARAEQYIRKTGKTKTDERFSLFADEIFDLYVQVGRDPYLAIDFAYKYGFAKGKRAQAASQRKAGARV